MAITYTDNGTNTPNGTHKIFTYTFPVLKTEDIKVALNGIVQATTKYTASLSPAQIEFNSTNADATVQNTSTGAPLSGVLVRVYRQTTVGKNSGDEDPKAVFAAGSSIRATDLNANQEQALFAIHELQNQEVLQEKIGTGAVTSAKILDGTIVDADINASADINGIKVNPNFGSQNISTTGTINNLTTTELAILDGATVSTAELNILDGATVTTTELNKLDGAIINTAELNILEGATVTTSELNILDGVTATTAEINKLDGALVNTAELNILEGATVTTAELNILDGVTATTAELNVLDGISVTTNELNNVYGIGGNIQSQLDNKQPIDAELTELATMSSGTASALADLTQAEVQTLDGVTATAAEINLNDGQTATAAEVNILDGATVNTTELNKLDGLTSSTTELNLLDGKSIVTSISGSATDTQIPSAQAVNERITTVVQDVGGFVPIANETSFPTANPDLNDAAGTIVSIKALASAFTTGSGVTTHTISNGAGSGKNVTITGLTQATTYPAGRGLILETTQYSGGGRGGDANEYEYAFHRLTLDETGVADAQAAIDDFDEKYYGPLSSNPATRPSGANRLNGDLYFNTSDGKMKVFNGSHASGTWDDVAAPGNFFINTLSSSSGSGGGSATFNGTATRFTLSNPPLTAQQLLVSVNGVVQKPNSGTSPSEGFAISGADIIFASAPATGAPYFIVTIGSSVNIGTPSNDTVGAAQIIDGSISNAEISSSAAIARTKLANVDLVDDTSPQLGGNLDTNGRNISVTEGQQITFGTSNDLVIYHNGTHSFIEDTGTGDLRLRSDKLQLQNPTGEEYFVGNSNGSVELYFNDVKKFETTALGATLSGELSATGANFTDDGQSSPIVSIMADDGSPWGLNLGNSTFGENLGLHAYCTNTGHVYIDNIGSGSTFPNWDMRLAHGSAAHSMVQFVGSDTSVKLYQGAYEKLATATYGTIVTGSATVVQEILKTNDGQTRALIYADSNNDVYILESQAHKVLKGSTNGAVQLYYDNVLKAHTYADGFKVDGIQRNVKAGYNYLLIGSNDASGATLTLDGDSNGDGAGGDYAYIEHGSDGDLSIVCDNPAGDSQFELYVGSGSTTAIVAQAAGEVQLYHNGGLKLNTDTYGIDVTGINSTNAHVKIHGNNCIGRSYWGYSTGYSGTVIGRTDNSVGSTIFMGVDVTTNASGSFGGQGNEIVFRNDHIFKTPNAANNNYVTPFRFGRATSTEGAVNFPQGLMFGSDQADANILDDYEEGQWTPTIHSGVVTSGSNVLSYSIQQGWYVRIGGFVQASFYINFSGKGNGNDFSMGGLPFTSVHQPYNSLSYSSSGSLGYQDCNFTNNAHNLSYVGNNAANIYYYNNNAGTHSPAASKIVSTGNAIAHALYGSVSYRAA